MKPWRISGVAACHGSETRETHPMSLEKVAKLAGVSNSTVSRVINNRPRVAPETEQAVRDAMDELGYTPSDRRPGPKPMSNREAATALGFFVVGGAEGSGTPGFMDLLRGVSNAAAAQDFNLTYDHFRGPDEIARRLAKSPLGGVILHGATFDGSAAAFAQRVPTVWVMGNRTRPTWGDQVMPDHHQIGTLAAEYFAERGHERLAFLNLDRMHWALEMCGYTFTAAAARLDRPVALLSHPREKPRDIWQPYRPEAIDALVGRFLKLDPRPTGLFVADSKQLAMVQPALVRGGVKLGPAPGGVQIVTCNREEPYLMGLDPRPAVIDVGIEAIGRQGVQHLYWRMEHAEVRERITCTIQPSLLLP